MLMPLLFAISLILLLGVLHYARSPYRKLPGPLPFPWLGNFLAMAQLATAQEIGYHLDDAGLQRVYRELRERNPIPGWVEKFRDLLCIHIGPVPAVLAVAPETAKAVLSSSGPLRKAWFYNFLHPWLGDGLLTTRGDKWRLRRRQLTPSFHYTILRNYFTIFQEQTDILCDVLRRKSAAAGDGVVDIGPLISHATLDMVTACAMGACVDSQREKSSAYVEAVYTMLTHTYDRMTMPLYWNDAVYALTPAGKRMAAALALLHKTSLDVIAARRSALEAAGDDAEDASKDFLDILLRAEEADGSPLSTESIREEVDTFLFEGHDTTSSGLMSALYFLGCQRHAHVQQRLQEEVDAVCGEGRDVPTQAELKDMPFLTAVINESLRLIPPVPILGRQTDKPLRVGKHVLPSGTQVMVPPLAIHMNRSVWGETAGEFRPERWIESGGRFPSFQHIPFSAGPRNCIGQQFAMLEEKTVLCMLVRRFTFHTVKDQELRLENKLIMKFKNNVVRMTVEER
eukprot:PLAT15857.1.p2 GENE.PLAT15857.1~~PLAT15857.1.p2  ORF type:complete len:512 (-),score=266.35 PLAT15857.1:40-1575(-)